MLKFVYLEVALFVGEAKESKMLCGQRGERVWKQWWRVEEREKEREKTK